MCPVQSLETKHKHTQPRASLIKMCCLFLLLHLWETVCVIRGRTGKPVPRSGLAIALQARRTEASSRAGNLQALLLSHTDRDVQAHVLSQGHGVFGFFHKAGPHTAATENEAMVFFQFKESLDCQRNHITATPQMNSSNGTALGWPYLYWASQECQDFSIHKKCTSGTNYLCHFSSTPQSQMIHIVRRALVFGVACVSSLHRFWE